MNSLYVFSAIIYQVTKGKVNRDKVKKIKRTRQDVNLCYELPKAYNVQKRYILKRL